MLATLEEQLDQRLLDERRRERWEAQDGRQDALASLSAHLNAATAHWLDLLWEMHEQGDSTDLKSFVAWRCGLTQREAGEYLRVAEALRELPAIRAAFSRGELTFTKVRALTRVAAASSEQGLLELAGVLTASQLERALRAFRRVADRDAHAAHELEYVNYYNDEDGSLILRARLAAEDGVLVIKALDAARERVLQRRREERAAAAEAARVGQAPDGAPERDLSSLSAVVTGAAVDPPRPAVVEALLELAEASLAVSDESRRERTRVVVHVDAAALVADGVGRSELEDGPVISLETARRLGCDAELVTQVERDGLPVSVGRARRTVPPALRRLLEARDEGTCCFPGCERRRHLEAHHRHHWAHGGETSLDNLVLLCFDHHRLVHDGGYTVEDDDEGGIRFRNRYGIVRPLAPPRPPPGSTDEIIVANRARGLEIDPRTLRTGTGERLDLGLTVAAIASCVG
ncbi:MAG: DUF222 domain-containing protein [Gaiellales bacterium]